MKKNFFLAGLLAALIFAAVSCSKDSEASLADRIPADAMMAGVVNLDRIADSAGGKVDGDRISFPDATTDPDANPAASLTTYNGCGFSLDKAGMWIDADGDRFITVVAICDEARTETFFSDKKYTKIPDGGASQIYVRDDNAPDDGLEPLCAVRDGYAYFFDREASAAEINAVIEKGVKQPLSATPFNKYIADGNAGGAVIDLRALAAMNDSFGIGLPMATAGRLCLKADINGDEATMRSVVLDDEGNKVAPDALGLKFDSKATVTADALAYIPPTECLVYAVALKDVDWDAAFSAIGRRMGSDMMQMMVMGMVKEYVSKIDGTVAFGIGFEGGKDDLLKAANDGSIVNYLPVTLVIEVAQGKAKGFLGDIRAVLATAGMKPSDLGDGFAAHIPGGAGMLYGKADGNTVVFSTRPIEKYDSNGATAALAGNLSGLGLCVPADYPLARDFGVTESLDASAVADMKAEEGIIRVRITGDGKAGFIERLMSLARAYTKGFYSLQYDIEDDSDFTPFDY